jgi:hypothetical protein
VHPIKPPMMHSMGKGENHENTIYSQQLYRCQMSLKVDPPFASKIDPRCC